MYSKGKGVVRHMGSIMPLILIASGVCTIFCAFMDYGWFMNHRKAAFFVAIFGRNGTRVFYIILGIVVIFLVLSDFF